MINAAKTFRDQTTFHSRICTLKMINISGMNFTYTHYGVHCSIECSFFYESDITKCAGIIYITMQHGLYIVLCSNNREKLVLLYTYTTTDMVVFLIKKIYDAFSLQINHS